MISAADFCGLGGGDCCGCGGGDCCGLGGGDFTLLAALDGCAAGVEVGV